MAKMDGSASANARAAKSKDLLAKQTEREKHLKKLKQNPYPEKDRIAVVEAQINRTKAARHKLADPVFTPSKTDNNTPTRELRTSKNAGVDVSKERENRDKSKNAKAEAAYKKEMLARKASRLKMLKGEDFKGSDKGWKQTSSGASAKYQRENYYKAPAEKPGMSGTYKLDSKTGKWTKK